MEFDPQDQDIVDLLTKLKNADGAYPVDLLSARRQRYVKSIAGIGLGAGIGSGIKHAIKRGNGTVPPSASGTFLEAVLVVTLVAEAGAVTYFYRDKLAGIWQSVSITPKVEQIASPPAITSPLPELEITLLPTVIATPTGTSVPGLTSDLGDLNSNVEVNQADATPDPNGNNGNHYGQTPEPDRIKDNGNNNINENQPPGQDKPPGGNKNK